MVKQNFSALWTSLLAAAGRTGDERLKAVLMNHESRKEHICRRLGVVSAADVRRMEAARAARKP
jgi:hypothetical protein